MKILHNFHPELPYSTKTLLGTSSRKVDFVDISPGIYKHFGLESGICHTLKLLPTIAPSNSIDVFVGIDGVKLTNSSSGQFWPIVEFLTSFPSSLPFVIGIYYGSSKPNDVNSFLRDFVTECNALSTIGFCLNSVNIKVNLKALICDAPARAMITCTKSHSSERHGCSRCTGFGVNVERLRTNHNFWTRRYPDHHHHLSSIMEEVHYFDMVFDLQIHPMHLIDLGVVKRLLSFLFGQRKRRRISGVTLSTVTMIEIDIFILLIRESISRIDFARVPRSTKEMPRWKATEFRLFLHYIGVVLLKPFLDKALYCHFLYLNVSIKILSSKELCEQYKEYAGNLLVHFVKRSERLYGKDFVSYNVHNLMHLIADVERFGTLYSFSAYRFENFYGTI